MDRRAFLVQINKFLTKEIKSICYLLVFSTHIPTHDLEIDILCLNKLNTVKIVKATLISGSNCKIYTQSIDLILPNIDSLHKIVTTNISYDLDFEKQELETLKDRLIQLPQRVDNNELVQARLSLDDTENMLSKISNNR